MEEGRIISSCVESTAASTSRKISLSFGMWEGVQPEQEFAVPHEI
jgi:hypothetical protein